MSKEKRNLIITVVGLTILLIGGLSATFAFYFATVNRSNTSSVIIKTGSISLFFAHGNTINDPNILPGWTTSRTLTITNNGSLPTSYALVWLTLNNEISHDELVISATC